ncbi:MAG: helix-turn-helix transcriptional regulator [Pontiellaceae bacterium]|nr:helix-turn-helix transcriptional regulator [Pontiellaceae bacterium]
MELTDNLRSFIIKERNDRDWSNADLARYTGFTEATWSRILNSTRPQKTIRDHIVAKIGDLFGYSPLDMMLISVGRVPEKQNTVNESEQKYSDKHERLAHWLRSTATAKQSAAVHATAEALGFEDCAPGEANCPRESNGCPGVQKKQQGAA